MDKAKLEEAWSEAQVANLLSVNNPETGEVYGAFAITNNLLQIFSLDPEKDYEVNPNTITAWQMLFSTESEALRYADYQLTLEALKPYVLARENGSVLVQKLSQEDLERVFKAAGGQISNSLVL